MRILLIEDDSGTARSIELMLNSESFNVYTTDLGEEGVDLGKIYDYDIIILDLKRFSAALKRLALRLRIAVGGDHYDGNVRSQCFGLGQEFKTVHPRHVDVGED